MTFEICLVLWGYNLEKIKFEVKELDAPVLLRDYLKQTRLSLTIIKKAKRTGIFVNGESVTVRKVIKNGDTVELLLPEEKSEKIDSIDIPLKVIYEDEYLIAVDKPTNMPTHPSKGNSLPTLANAVMHYFGGNFVFRAINRLDRDTSGIVIIAKDQITAAALSGQMKASHFKKKYICIVEGHLTERHGIINAPIRRESADSIKRIIADDGKIAVTEYTVIEERDECSVCEIILHTGRTHQIRVHMAHIGHALVGDFLYGKRDDNGYFLRCTEIGFCHPVTNEYITVKV